MDVMILISDRFVAAVKSSIFKAVIKKCFNSVIAGFIYNNRSLKDK